MALAILIHIAVSSLTGVLLGLAAGRLGPLTAGATLAAGTAAGLFAWLRLRKYDRPAASEGPLPMLLYGFIIFAGLQQFLYLLYDDGHLLKTMDVSNLGDLPMHIQYIRHFARGHFWPQDPEFAASLLRYPLGMDLYNTLWEILGVPIDSHLFLTGTALTIVAVVMLRRWMGWWGVGAFFLNGGFANWRVLATGVLHDYQQDLAWKSFFLTLWVTQRGFLFALPAGVYVLKMMIETILGERQMGRDEKIACGFLWAALSLFHLHTFFIITLIVGISMLLYRQWKETAFVAIPAVLAGMVFVVFSMGGLSGKGVVHLRWGWQAESGHLIGFWIMNLGPWVVLTIAAMVQVFRRPFARLRPLAIAAILLFFAFTWVMVAPWDWDNIKVLMWLYLVIAWLIWRTVVTPLPSPLPLVLGLVVFLPGAVPVATSLPGKNAGTEVYKTAEVWEAKSALRNLSADAVLAAVPVYNHPAAYWGARFALGYTGHVWSHGTDYAEREGKLEKVYKGDPDWPALAREIGVTHVYWGEREKIKYRGFDPPFQHLNNVSGSPDIQIYDLRAGGGGQ